MIGRLVLALCALLALPAAASADEYVASAYSARTGDVSFSVGATKEAVERGAMETCRESGADDCKGAYVGTDMCISLARSADRQAFGLAAEPSREASQAEALGQCEKQGGTGCSIHETHCAPSSME